MKANTETINGVTFTLEIEPEDLEIRGNALASGDDAEDREAEDSIIAQLESGNLWAWCSVKVTATAGGVEGVDYLGGCSYRDTAEFIQPGGYYDDMKAEALAELKVRLAEASAAHVALEVA